MPADVQAELFMCRLLASLEVQRMLSLTPRRDGIVLSFICEMSLKVSPTVVGQA